MEKATPRKPDWDRLQRASDAHARWEYEHTTPGQRVEVQLELSRELTALASRAHARR